MITITVTIYYSSGMSSDTFSDSIMIDRPYGKTERVYEIGDELDEGATLQQMIDLFRNDSDCDIGIWAKDKITIENAYVYIDNMFLGLLSDKPLLQIAKDLERASLHIVFFCVAGGASREYQGFRFIVHPREDIHRYKPHVHVKKGEYETRYSLETFERFPEDEFSREFKKKEKTIIVPYLKKHVKELMELWNLYLNGYTSPEITLEGKQYYRES